MERLDPQLRVLLDEHRRAAAARPEPVRPRGARTLLGAGETAAPEAEEPIRVTIEFRGEIADIEALGFVRHSVVAHPTKGYKIATGTIPARSLEALSAVDHVVVISTPHPVRPLLNYSAHEIKALAVHKKSPGGATGKGVVVGMIDSGLEVRHGDFWADGFTSRVLALWDQKTDKTDGAPGRNGLGRIYDRATIQQALTAKKILGTEDKVGHGTMVMGIAAGDGSPGTCCVGANTYIGIAPDAEIIAVSLSSGGALGDSQNAIDALDFIFTHPDGAGKPLAVNISLGVMRGAHDGSTPFEKAIDAHIASRQHAVVVVAAGNFADSKWHTKGTVGPNGGTLDVKFNIADGDVTSRFLEVWYPNGPGLSVKLSAPGDNILKPSGGTHADGILPPDQGAYLLEAEAHGAKIVVSFDTPAPENNDNRIQLNFTGGARPKGEWTLRLINPAAAAVDFHAWLEREQRDNDHPPTFSQPTKDVTISVPATALDAIAVAAFKNRANCCDCFPSGDIADFSSLGPVRANAAANAKPNIAAPGIQITTAAAGAANLRGNCCDCCPDWCCCLFDSADGTSLAAPHVTGAVALMFEANPNLTRDDVASVLAATALPAAAPADPTIWGAGKLNAEAAVDRARQMAAGGPVHPVAVMAAPRRAAAESVMLGTPAEAAMRMLAARIRAVPNGEAYAALISRHFSEIRRLINDNPRIATVWHRGEGPLMLRRLLEGTVDERAPPPIRTEAQRAYLAKFFDQLGRQGSARLQESIAAAGDAVIRLLERPLAAHFVGRA